MSERRNFQSQRVRIGVALAFLLILGGGGLFTYHSYDAVLNQEADTHSFNSSGNRTSANSSGGGIVQGRGGIQGTTDDVREAALQMDRQLMAKLERKNREQRSRTEMSYDSNYSSRDIRERVREDYDEVKKAKQLSDGMKADFKKHHDNIIHDITH